MEDCRVGIAHLLFRRVGIAHDLPPASSSRNTSSDSPPPTRRITFTARTINWWAVPTLRDSKDVRERLGIDTGSRVEFVEIEPGIDGMIHVSDLSWTRKYSHPSEALKRGQQVKCVVREVNEEKQRISLGVKQMTEDPWVRAIPGKYIPGQIIKGTITKLTNFGAFVELEPDLEGLLHISELADHKIENPQDIVKRSDEVEVKILKVDTEARKIGLSLRRARWAAEEQAGENGQQQVATDVQSALADSDTDKAAEPQAQDDDSGEAEAGTETEQGGQKEETEVVVDSEAGDTEETKKTEEPEKTRHEH